MSERHVRSRKAIPRGKTPVQETFVALLAPEPALVASPGERAPAVLEGGYRVLLASWPLRWRERWGRRANALEDQGLEWRSAELAAFTEVWEERRKKSPSKRRPIAVPGSN
jgi:hypothetical protein